VPSRSGRYRATIGVYTEAPPTLSTSCESQTCSIGGGPYVAPADLCIASSTPIVNVEFDLPASGDIVVPVVIE